MSGEKFVVAIDTREQLPYKFASSKKTTLNTGDYSIVGYEDRIAVERKTKKDAYGSLGSGRKRFEKELIRLSGLEYAAVVIESSLTGFLEQPSFSKMNPRSAVCSIIAWSVKYGVHMFFSCDRPHGQALTYHILERFYVYHVLGGVKCQKIN